MPTEMAATASRRALRAAGIAADDLDVIIYTGVHKDHGRWQASNKVQVLLQAMNSYVFDLDQNAAGPVMGIVMACSLLRDGEGCRNVLVCGGENWHTSLDGRLLGRSFLMGDAASAVVVSGSGGPLGIVDWELGCLGRYSKAICMPELGAVTRMSEDVLRRGGHLLQLFDPGWKDEEERKRVTGEFNSFCAGVVSRLLSRNGLGPSDLSAFVLPNLPAPHTTSLVEAMGIAHDAVRQPTLSEAGVCGGPDLMMNLERLVRSGVEPGGHVLVLGVGAGYHASAVLLKAR